MGAGFPAPCIILGKGHPGLATYLNNEKDFDIDKLIRRILWGKIYFDIKDKTFLLRHLSIKEQNYLDYIYDKELEKVLPTIQLCEPLYSPCAGALMEAYRINNIDWSSSTISHFAK